MSAISAPPQKQPQKQHSLKSLQRKINVVLALFMAVNFLYWFASSDVYGKWAGVPPVPSRDGALVMALSDIEFSYRSGALMLQGLGDSGGKTTALKDYDYMKLGNWFARLDELNPASDHVPMAAAYYFGATRVPKDIRVIVDYLGAVGSIPVGEKWRWLAQAVYLAQHRLQDLDLALDLAYTLSKMDVEMPMWARQMPIFVLKARGEKEDAQVILENMIATGKNLDPAEINFMKMYLTDELGVPAEDVEKTLKMRSK